jgi:hypothetical protein
MMSQREMLAEIEYWKISPYQMKQKHGTERLKGHSHLKLEDRLLPFSFLEAQLSRNAENQSAFGLAEARREMIGAVTRVPDF